MQGCPGIRKASQPRRRTPPPPTAFPPLLLAPGLKQLSQNIYGCQRWARRTPVPQFKWAMRNPGLGSASSWGLRALPGDWPPGDYGFSSGSGGKRAKWELPHFPWEDSISWSMSPGEWVQVETLSLPGSLSSLLSLGLNSLGISHEGFM